MIITPERLIELAKDEVEARTSRQKLTAAYLVGSVLDEEPLLGDCADIDIIMIHPTAPLRDREVKRLSRQVHLDVYHKSRQDFENPRQLRSDPLLGDGVCRSLRLYDPDHFFDWAQAAACARFTRADNRLARAITLLERGRDGWRRIEKLDPLWPTRFQAVAWHGANALCCLQDMPNYGRRSVHQLQTQMEQLGASSLYGRFLQLFRVGQMDQWNVPSWLTGFGKAFDLAIDLNSGEPFKPVRRDYYLKAFQSMAEAGKPEAAVILMLRYWPLPANATDPIVQKVAEAETWQSLLAATGFKDSNFDEKRFELEEFLDEIELFVERWGEAHGV